MIERLLAAFAEGAEDGAAPRTALGPEEIADILWLAARVDPGAAPSRHGDGHRPAPPEPEEPPPAPADPGPAPDAGRTGPPHDGAVQLFPAGRARPEPPPTAPGAEAHARRGVPLRLPRTTSLDDPLALMRSLRPVGRRSIGGPGEELDEQLTVERSIEAMVPTPVLRPAESRWLDLALVVDAHPSMLLWSDLVAELRGVFTRSGVFRDVRTWQLTGTAPGGTPMLARGHGGPPRNPLELADPAGRRLILLVSDTVAGGWQEAPLLRVLRHWSAHNAVAVLNVLPERLWTRGAVRPVPFAVRCDRPAAATRAWQRVPATRRARGGGPVVPVVGLASGSLARLVRTVSGDGRWRRLACLRLDAAPAPGTAPPRRDTTALEAVERFRASASPTAQQLAAHLAAVPLTLPVMTLVRRSLLRDSEHGHLAEVALGGLFAPWEGRQRPEEAEFDFLPGVREVLLGSQLRGDVAAVRELVRRRVWEFMYRNRGTGPDFSATRVTTGEEGRRLVPEGDLPFAERPAAQRPPADRPFEVRLAEQRGVRDAVVQVRFEPLAEPREVGTLLGPRLVLTVGDVEQPRDAVAWVRGADGRETACRPVWWDEASPRVLLLEGEADLADPRRFVPPGWEVPPADQDAEAVVDGFEEVSARRAFFGHVLLSGGARNGELLRFPVELGDWHHFRGAPVSRGGRLTGIVHTVRPDRMVFLTAEALLAQDGFREALSEREHWTGVTVALRGGEAGYGPGSPPRQELSDLLSAAMAEAEVAGRPEGGPAGVRVSLAGPRAFAEAGLLLLALHRLTDRDRLPGPPFVVALAAHGAGGEEGVADRLLQSSTVTAWVRTSGPDHTLRLVLTLSQSLYEQLRELLGPLALRSLKPLREEPGGWFLAGDPSRVAELLADAETYRLGEPVWLRCGFGASAEDPAGCMGVGVAGRHTCLAHLPRSEQDAYLSTLEPASSVDFRGTTFEGGLLGRLLDALRDPRTGTVVVDSSAFTRACFKDDWAAADAVFNGETDFTGAVFEGLTGFAAATFGGDTSFDGAVFREAAGFGGTLFARTASFRRAVFEKAAVFEAAEFEEEASFGRAVFVGAARFARGTWDEGVLFGRAVMEEEAVFDGVVVRGRADFDRAVFKGRTSLRESLFRGPVSFTRVVCEGPLSALGARLELGSDFASMVCEGEAVFREVRFDGPASFASAVFHGLAAFDTASFLERAGFERARFRGPVLIKNSVFAEPVSFDHAVFEGMFRWVESRTEPGPDEDTEWATARGSFAGAVFRGPARFLRGEFGGGVVFDAAHFDGSVTFEACDFRAALFLTGALFHGPASLTGVTLGRPIRLPADWTATEEDGVWEITSPERPESGDA
ncbi:SAV_2336 N-terminal domain-related protein [Streptomyces sp. NBC_00158]|uniref:SAV_2336 N-terminal domain-related protein n=1 Tax=Streptomyces sp. NBC_00158 TaxID=2903627 RepID=UPI003254E208